MTENNRRQAYLPEGCVVLDNPHGTAPGFVALRADGKFVACMPGVPREMKPMLAEQLVPVAGRSASACAKRSTPGRCTRSGSASPQLDQRIEDLFRTLENPKIAMLAHGGRVDVKVMAKATAASAADALIEPVAAELRARIGSGYFGDDDVTLAGRDRAASSRGAADARHGGVVHGRRDRRRDRRASPGASAVFRGAIVAYDNAVKTRAARRARGDARAAGAVSEETAVAMARGARAAAGRRPGDRRRPGSPGRAAEPRRNRSDWCGSRSPWRDGEIETRRLTFPGDRADIRERATLAALSLIWRRLERDVHARDRLP